MVRTSSGPDTEADADTGTAERAGDLWDGLLTAVRHCCALVVTVLLAVVLDGLVVLAGRVLMPWTRRRATARADREGV